MRTDARRRRRANKERAAGEAAQAVIVVLELVARLDADCRRVGEGQHRNAAARDYARVGLAVMNQNPKIISKEWAKRISTPVVKLDYGWGYSAQAWHPYPGINLMLGLHGQFIYMDKAHDTVIVKLSDEPTQSDNRSPMVAAVLKQIAEKA